MKFKSIMAVFAVAISATTAHATVIDLSSLPIGNFNSPVTIGDYVLTPRNNGSAEPTIGQINGTSVIAGTNGGAGDDTFLTRADGQSFTLNSVDIGLLSGYSSTGQAVGFSGNISNLNGVATSVLQTINFGSKFSSVKSIDLDALAGASFANITVTAAVPEPATWALMLVGMGVVGFAMRRRATVSVSYA